VSELTLSEAPSATSALLIRRPVAEVFRAIADPAVTTRFWYTKSSGPMTPGATLRWDWEMYGVNTDVRVEAVDEHKRIRFTWSGYNPQRPTTVEFTFLPQADDATYVRVVESGFTGTGDEVARHAVESTAGFTFVLCGLKALLEHDLELGIIGDVHLTEPE
jgi:uncharacterized protein YndB with AHSA1/START domain